MKNIVLVYFLLFVTTTIYADINYECAILQIRENKKMIYNRLDKTQHEPFAKTKITKRTNLIFDGTFYYQYRKSKNGSDFYYNETYNTIVAMSSKPVNNLDGSNIYSFVIQNEIREMGYICKEE